MTTKINDYLDRIGIYDELRVRLVVPSPHALRYASADIKELMDSIEAHGLLEPVIVRPSGEKFELVAGHRRFEACKKLRFKKISAIVADLNDKEAFEFSLIENLQRETLGSLEETRAFKSYCDKFGWGSQTELAKKIGKSQEYVSHRMRLLTLPDEIKDMLDTKKMSLTEAKKLSWAPELSPKLHHLENARPDNYYCRPNSSIHSEADLMLREEQRVVNDSVLIVRIALVRIDNLISRAKSEVAKDFLIGKRKQLHSLLDESISFKSFLESSRESSSVILNRQPSRSTRGLTRSIP